MRVRSKKKCGTYLRMWKHEMAVDSCRQLEPAARKDGKLELPPLEPVMGGAGGGGGGHGVGGGPLEGIWRAS